MAKDENFKKGYTVIDNKLLQAIYEYKFNGTEFKIIFCIMRATYGFHKTNYELSLSYIAKAINVDKTIVSKKLKKLIEKKVVKIYQNETNSKARKIGINKNFKQWGLIKSSTLELIKSSTVDKKLNSGVDKKLNSGVDKNINQKIHIKNTYKNTYSSCDLKSNRHEYEDDVFLEFWKMYKNKGGSKWTTYQFWLEQGYSNEDKQKILKSVEVLNKSDNWQKENGRFVPLAKKFLENDMWIGVKEEKQQDGKMYLTVEDLERMEREGY